jgi:hypothetical protein
MAGMLHHSFACPHGWHAAYSIAQIKSPPHYFVVLSALGCRIPPD